jgi:hypothetical protein
VVFNNPTCHALTDFQSYVAQISLMRNLRGPQYNFVRFAFNQINQAGIAVGYLNRETHNLSEHLVE